MVLFLQNKIAPKAIYIFFFPSPRDDICEQTLKTWLWLFFHWFCLWGIFPSTHCVLCASLISLTPMEMKLLQCLCSREGSSSQPCKCMKYGKNFIKSFWQTIIDFKDFYTEQAVLSIFTYFYMRLFFKYLEKKNWWCKQLSQSHWRF